MLLLMLPAIVYASDSYYCPQKHAYINVGMNQAQVIAACGQPTTVRTSNNPVLQQIPVTQLIYTKLNQGAVDFYPGLNPVYDMWSLPSGSSGTSLEVDIINDQINSIRINGSDSNAASICEGGSMQIGDSVSKLYNACGAPSMVNQTYINKPVAAQEKPQVWIYTIDQYQPSVTLTFVNGILQSIN